MSQTRKALEKRAGISKVEGIPGFGPPWIAEQHRSMKIRERREKLRKRAIRKARRKAKEAKLKHWVPQEGPQAESGHGTRKV